ncbi:MAG: phosphotransferase [Bacilli bacterium]
MDKRALPPWLRQVWNELTQPPAVLHRSRRPIRSRPVRNPVSHNDERAKTAAAESADEESLTDPPSAPRRAQGSAKTAERLTRRYFVPHPGRQPTKTRPRPRKNGKRTAHHNESARMDASAVQTAQSAPAPARIQTLRIASTGETASRPPRASDSDAARAGAYHEHIRSVEAIHGVWRIVTSDGKAMALKETRLAPERIRFMADAIDELHRRGFTHLARIVRTRQDQDPYLVDHGRTYYASEWLPGHSVQYGSTKQLGAAARTLARFHEKSGDYEPSGYQPPHAFHVFEQLLNRKQSLDLAQKQLEAKANKDSFDELCLSYFPQAAMHATESLSLLKLPDVETHLKHSLSHPGLCHLDVTRRNLVMHPAGHAQLIDFDLMTFAPRALDLSHLIRRGMQAHGTWTSEVAIAPLISYNRVRPLTQGEYLLLEALLTFPHRFWRLLQNHDKNPAPSPEDLQQRTTQMEDTLALEQERAAFLHTFSRQVTRRSR